MDKIEEITPEYVLCPECRDSLREDYLMQGVCPVCYKKSVQDAAELVDTLVYEHTAALSSGGKGSVQITGGRT